MQHSFLNPLVSEIPSSGIRKFFDFVLEAGPDVISLGVGEPDFPTPWHIRYQTIRALEEGVTSYTSNKGMTELRAAISKDISERYNVRYDYHEEVLVTNGVSEGMDLAFRACICPGDTVLIPDPSYVMYEPLIRLAQGDVSVYNPLDLSDLITAMKSAKIVVLNYPGNPIGNTFSLEELEKIARAAERENCLIFSDEIYGLLSYKQEHYSFPAIEGMKERTIYFNGLSKSHSMTGYRIGWVCGPSEIIQAITRIHQYSALCASSFGQRASIEALENGESEAEKMKQEYDQRRLFCIKKLKELGLVFYPPSGAFYIFVNIQSTGLSSSDFCHQLLENEKLAVVPGNAFGPNGEGYIRMTYAENREALKEAFIRLERFLVSIGAASSQSLKR